MVQEIIRKNEKGKDEVIRKDIYVNGKLLKMRFTMPMWYRLEDEVCIMDDLYTMMHSKGRFGRGKIPKVVEILTDGEVTADDFLKEKDPATISQVMHDIQGVIAKAVTMKEKKYDDDSVHDEVLEEIEKKDRTAD